MLHHVFTAVAAALVAFGAADAVEDSDWAKSAIAADPKSWTPAAASWGTAVAAGIVVGLISGGVHHAMK